MSTGARAAQKRYPPARKGPGLPVRSAPRIYTCDAWQISNIVIEKSGMTGIMRRSDPFEGEVQARFRSTANPTEKIPLNG